MKAAERNYYKFINGEDMSGLCTRSKNDLIRFIQNRIRIWRGVPANWNYGTGAEWHKAAEDLEKGLAEFIEKNA